ncbi:MAG TPA: GspH/FimT family protein [Arenimonas sp.]|nr:GspH/FimT family protein [Arenimonas sp.]
MARTSATGTERGFSLVELLVVLTVFGLLGAAVLLTVPGGGARLGDQADQLSAHLQRAREEAVLGNRAIALRVDAGGYRFERRGWEGWQVLAAAPLHARQFPDGVRADFAGRDQVARFEFDATGAAVPAEVVLRGGDAALRLALQPSGEVRIDAAR